MFIKTHHRFFSFAATLVTLGIIGLLGLDSFGNPASTQKLLGISSKTIFFIGIVFLLGFRIVIGHIFSTRLTKSWLYLASVLLCLSSILMFGESLTSDNYLYSLTRINALELFFFAHGLLAFCLINQSAHWWKKHLRTILNLAPFWLLAASWLVVQLPFDRFVSYASEDGFIEYLQVVVLLLNVSVLGIKAYSLSRQQQLTQALKVSLLALAFLFVLMEEISWGQRLLGWETPEALADINVQNETTIHNIGIFNQLQLVGYIGLSFLGSSLLLGRSWLQKRLPKSMIYPLEGTAWFFVLTLVFYVVYILTDHAMHRWTEIIELLLYTGLSLWVIHGIVELGRWGKGR